MSIQTVKRREAWERFAVYQGMIALLMLLILEDGVIENITGGKFYFSRSR